MKDGAPARFDVWYKRECGDAGCEPFYAFPEPKTRQTGEPQAGSPQVATRGWQARRYVAHLRLHDPQERRLTRAEATTPEKVNVVKTTGQRVKYKGQREPYAYMQLLQSTTGNLESEGRLR